MSMVYGKRINRKQANVSTAAVYPILQSTLNKSGNTDMSDCADSDFVTRHIRGQCVRGRPVTEQTIVSSVAEFVSEVIPQGNTPSTVQSEAICWVKIQKCPCDFRGRVSTFLIVIGLARGYQIWTMLENGDCEEVVSERKGPIRTGHVLPFSVNRIDKFRTQRPLFAMVDGNPMLSDQKMCTISFLSLRHGKIAHTLDLSDPVLDIDGSEKCMLAILAESLVVIDHESLAIRHIISVPASESSITPYYALSDELLAFCEFNLDKQKLSCGGVVQDDETSYSGQVMNAAKSLSKTMTSIGESFVSSFTSTHQCKSAQGGSDAPDTDDSGIVSVINVNRLPPSNEKLSVEPYIAHFVAHQASPIGHLAFGNGGQLLLTGTRSSTTFHLFLLHPHPTCAKLGSIQHIYTLYRGNSAAKVIHSAFSADNRWLSIATNHGTTHVFAITPYGGPVNARTHCSKFVNKETRFQQSAGITSVKQAAATKSTNPSKTSTKAPFREHPAVISLPVISKTMENSRLTYYAPPIELYSLAKIKQRAFSAESLSAWAFDNTPTLLGNASGGRQTTLNNHRNMTANGYPACLGDACNRRLVVSFDMSFGAAAVRGEYGSCLSDKGRQSLPLCLYIMSAEGVLVEHQITIRREGHSTNGGLSSTLSAMSGTTDQPALSSSPTSNDGLMSATAHSARVSQQDASIRAKVAAVIQWILRRNRGASSVEVIDPPLAESNTLLQLYTKAVNKSNSLAETTDTMREKSASDNNVSWLQQVEVVTYSGPHRRLWMGPQFSFGVYASSGHSSAQLYNPKSNPENSTFPTLQKCCPVLIEKNSPATINSNDNTTSRIVCGSWSSDVVDQFGDATYTSVKEKIEDAMRDISEPTFVTKKVSTKRNKKKSKEELRNGKYSGGSSGANDSCADLLQLSGMEL